MVANRPPSAFTPQPHLVASTPQHNTIEIILQLYNVSFEHSSTGASPCLLPEMFGVRQSKSGRHDGATIATLISHKPEWKCNENIGPCFSLWSKDSSTRSMRMRGGCW